MLNRELVRVFLCLEEDLLQRSIEPPPGECRGLLEGRNLEDIPAPILGSLTASSSSAKIVIGKGRHVYSKRNLVCTACTVRV